jgi:hypothetical protein
LTDTGPDNDIILFQRRADDGEREWSFQDPLRVACNGLARLLKIDENAITGVKETRRTQGRIVYQWRPDSKGATYMAVVSRPYVLSFFAKDGKKVAWVVIAAYESSCDEGNSVTRIR